MANNIDRLKKKAAEKAVDHVVSGNVLGLGTGSTVRFALERLAVQIKAGAIKDVVGIPSSIQTEEISLHLGIPLTSFDHYTKIDLTIDGADEVDPALNLIKGGGGALLREKVLAQASNKNIIIIDKTKFSKRIGTRWPVPIEIIPFAWPVEAAYLRTLEGEPLLRMKGDGSPFTTDQGNYVLDCRFGVIHDPDQLAASLEGRAGIVEHGLFLHLATEVIIADEDGIKTLKRPSPLPFTPVSPE
jgi:ribose 5-phosphate isomerase A